MWWGWVGVVQVVAGSLVLNVPDGLVVVRDIIQVEYVAGELPEGARTCVVVDGVVLDGCQGAGDSRPLFFTLTWDGEPGALVQKYGTVGDERAGAIDGDGRVRVDVESGASVVTLAAVAVVGGDRTVVETSQAVSLIVPNSRRRLKPYACNQQYCLAATPPTTYVFAGSHRVAPPGVVGCNPPPGMVATVTPHRTCEYKHVAPKDLAVAPPHYDPPPDVAALLPFALTSARQELDACEGTATPATRSFCEVPRRWLAAVCAEAQRALPAPRCGEVAVDATTPPAEVVIHQPTHFDSGNVRHDGDRGTLVASSTLPFTKIMCRGTGSTSQQVPNTRCSRRRSCALHNLYFLDGEWFMLRDDWNVVGHLQWDAALVHPTGGGGHPFSRAPLCDVGVWGGAPFSVRVLDSQGFRDKLTAAGASVRRVQQPHVLLARSSPDVFGHVLVDELLPAVWALVDHSISPSNVGVVLTDTLGHRGPTSASAQLLGLLCDPPSAARCRLKSAAGPLCGEGYACMFDTVVAGAGCRSFLFPSPALPSELPRRVAVMDAARELFKLRFSLQQPTTAAPSIIIVNRRRSRVLLPGTDLVNALAALPHTPPATELFLEDLPLGRQATALAGAQVVVAVDGSALELAALTMGGSCPARTAVVVVVPAKGYSHLHFHNFVSHVLPCRAVFAVELPECVWGSQAPVTETVILNGEVGGEPPPITQASAQAPASPPGHCLPALVHAVQRAVTSIRQI